MAYKIVPSFLPASKYPLKSPYPMKAKYITIHNTANDAAAQGEANYMKLNNNQVSYHVAIDDKEVVEIIPFNRSAWHAGDGNGQGNRASIGIEICYSKSGGARYKVAETNAIEYAAQALIQLGLEPEDVKFHQEWSGKNCPHRILDEGRGDAFKAAIAKRYNEIKKGDKAPVKAEVKPKPKPAPAKPIADDIYRVKIDGKQVGAYGSDKNVLEQVEKALKGDKKKIEVERV
ncbi:peptidoglycan recognition protein family protein [Exiguobacterium antarcticum]|uniref:peptidoglycan recognition protein family protein n=1 Tax=Exiguobacterium antarcticum TaxID=132920 RepID=UPI00068BE273|nr:N-acetylmuramoyl-L-alanine amidase [Exiguobacterium antarcticum]